MSIMKTVVFGLLLAFLLFTPQGREIGINALGLGALELGILHPAAEPTVAEKEAANEKWARHLAETGLKTLDDKKYFYNKWCDPAAPGEFFKSKCEELAAEHRFYEANCQPSENNLFADLLPKCTAISGYYSHDDWR
jgi:hypothetical protein